MNQTMTYKFKLKPTKVQRETFGQWLGTCRYVYNLCLDYKKQLYSGHSISINKNDMQKELSSIARETEWIGTVHSQTLQAVTDRLFLAYERFFKQGKGFPRFARKGSYRSFTFKQGVKVHGNTSTIRLPKIGKVKYRKSRNIEGKIKTAAVIEQVDGWYISITCERDIEPIPKATGIVGLDVGIKSYLVTSDGEDIENPKYLYKYQYKLARAQRSVSRKKKGSKNRKKAVNELARIHLKIRETRKDFQQKLSTRLVGENQTIAVEKLQIKNMVKNHRLARSISDAGWGSFVSMLEYKCKWHGRNLVKVDPKYTSQDCSVCGHRNSGLTLAVREWVCPDCGTIHCRDTNAAINIRNKGVGHTPSAWEVYSGNGRVAQESHTL